MISGVIIVKSGEKALNKHLYIFNFTIFAVTLFPLQKKLLHRYCAIVREEIRLMIMHMISLVPRIFPGNSLLLLNTQ